MIAQDLHGCLECLVSLALDSAAEEIHWMLESSRRCCSASCCLSDRGHSGRYRSYRVVESRHGLWSAVDVSRLVGLHCLDWASRNRQARPANLRWQRTCPRWTVKTGLAVVAGSRDVVVVVAGRLVFVVVGDAGLLAVQELVAIKLNLDSDTVAESFQIRMEIPCHK